MRESLDRSHQQPERECVHHRVAPVEAVGADPHGVVGQEAAAQRQSDKPDGNVHGEEPRPVGDRKDACGDGRFLGYSLGAKYIEKIYSNGMMEILTKAAGIVGLIMVGAMTSKTVLFKTILDFTMKGKSVMDVQSSLDSIFIGIVPLLLTFGCFKLLKKKVNIIVLIFGIVALGIILSVLGIC